MRLPRFPLAHSANTACRRRPVQLFDVLDLQGALYRIIRPVVTGESVAVEETANICAAVKLRHDTLHELHNHLGQGPLLAAAGTQDWAAGAVAESSQHTRFRSGDSLSDLVFSFLFAKVLEQVRPHPLEL